MISPKFSSTFIYAPGKEAPADGLDQFHTAQRDYIAVGTPSNPFTIPDKNDDAFIRLILPPIKKYVHVIPNGIEHQTCENFSPSSDTYPPRARLFATNLANSMAMRQILEQLGRDPRTKGKLDRPFERLLNLSKSVQSTLHTGDIREGLNTFKALLTDYYNYYLIRKKEKFITGYDEIPAEKLGDWIVKEGVKAVTDIEKALD